MPNRVILLALAGALALSAGCAVNPVTGDEELMFFPPEDDVKLGRQYAGPIEKELGGRIADENLQRYVNDVGQKMARVCHQPDISYHFTAVEDRMINAFALPGGYVFITRGLLKEMKTEGQLASVNGATQIRAGVIRPEIIVPVQRARGEAMAEAPAQVLMVGVRVRVIREPHFGALGRVTELPSELTEIETESKVRIAMVTLDGGEVVRVPRANLELIQE